MNFIEIWDDFSPVQRHDLCNVLNEECHPNAHYHPGLLGITNIETILNLLGITWWISPSKLTMLWVSEIERSLKRRGYALKEQYQPNYDMMRYKIEKVGEINPRPHPNSISSGLDSD